MRGFTDAYGHGYSYADGNPWCKCYSDANGYTNRNSKHYAQAGSYTTPASYYAAAASVGWEMLIANSRIADGL